MKLATSVNDPEITDILRAGGIGVIRTDTLYGLVALANNFEAVERVYDAKSRDEKKSPIVLISGLDQLYDQPHDDVLDYLDSVWPGKVSVILPSVSAPDWIKRANGSVAYRMPDDSDLQELLTTVGPLIAPSANPEGLEPAMNIDEAQAYFGNTIDFYVDGGQVTDTAPSQLIHIDEKGEKTRLR